MISLLLLVWLVGVGLASTLGGGWLYFFPFGIVGSDFGSIEALAFGAPYYWLSWVGIFVSSFGLVVRTSGGVMCFALGVLHFFVAGILLVSFGFLDAAVGVVWAIICVSLSKASLSPKT